MEEMDDVFSMMFTLWWTNILQWKDPPFLMGKSTISTGPFSIVMLNYMGHDWCPHGSHHPTMNGIWSMPWLLFQVMSFIFPKWDIYQPLMMFTVDWDFLWLFYTWCLGKPAVRKDSYCSPVALKGMLRSHRSTKSSDFSCQQSLTTSERDLIGQVFVSLSLWAA